MSKKPFVAAGDSALENRGRRVWFSPAVFLLLFIYGMGFSITSGVGFADESWFLQVLHRVSSGEVLYRDVFYGATPLPIYVSLIPVYVLGAEILVLKAVVSAFFVLTVLVACRVAVRLGCEPKRIALVVGALLVYAPPDPNSAYSPVSYFFLLLCFLFTLSWLDAGKKTALAMASAAAALSFLSKQNIGVLAFLALVFTVFMASRRDTGLGSRVCLSSILLAMGTFLGVTLAGLLPIVLTGGFEQLMDYGFLNKGTYLQTAGISYVAKLKDFFAVFTSPSVQNLVVTYMALPILLPFFTFSFLVAAWVLSNATRRRVCECAFFFSAVAFMGAFPRFDFVHLFGVVPIIVLGLACGWHGIRKHLSRRLAQSVAVVVCLWLMIGLGADLTHRVLLLGSDSYRVSSLPHFQGALFPAPFYNYLLDYRKALAEHAPDGQILLIFPDAGLSYLISGLKNPTPFDYPLVSAFGLTGEESVIRQLAAGQIRTVCMRSLMNTGLESLRPARLEDYVRSQMQPIEDLGLCTVYRSPLK
jgi:hypothetical protein